MVSAEASFSRQSEHVTNYFCGVVSASADVMSAGLVRQLPFRSTARGSALHGPANAQNSAQQIDSVIPTCSFPGHTMGTYEFATYVLCLVCAVESPMNTCVHSPDLNRSCAALLRGNKSHMPLVPLCLYLEGHPGPSHPVWMGLWWWPLALIIPVEFQAA